MDLTLVYTAAVYTLSGYVNEAVHHEKKPTV